MSVCLILCVGLFVYSKNFHRILLGLLQQTRFFQEKQIYNRHKLTLSHCSNMSIRQTTAKKNLTHICHINSLKKKGVKSVLYYIEKPAKHSNTYAHMHKWMCNMREKKVVKQPFFLHEREREKAIVQHRETEYVFVNMFIYMRGLQIQTKKKRHIVELKLCC